MSLGNSEFKESRRLQLTRAIKEGHAEVLANQRMRGRTTAIALDTISKAMSNPGRDIFFKDHSDTQMGHHLLYGYIRVALEDLGLVGFTLKRGSLTYTLDYIYE